MRICAGIILAAACLAAGAAAGSSPTGGLSRSLRLTHPDGAQESANGGGRLILPRRARGDDLALRIRGGGSLPLPLASAAQSPTEGTVKIKLAINYGVEGGSIVAVGPHKSFGNGDIHKGERFPPCA